MKKPTVHPDAFVAFNATVRGDVRIEEGASIFYGAVLRGRPRANHDRPRQQHSGKLRRACGV